MTTPDSFITMPASQLQRLAEACLEEIKAERQEIFEQYVAEESALDLVKAKSWWRMFWFEFKPRSRKELYDDFRNDMHWSWEYRVHRYDSYNAANELLAGLSLANKREVQVSLKTLGLISCSASRSINFEAHPYRVLSSSPKLAGSVRQGRRESLQSGTVSGWPWRSTSTSRIVRIRRKLGFGVQLPNLARCRTMALLLTEEQKYRKLLLTLVWRHTHKDFKGKFSDGTKTVLKFVPSKGTCLVPLDSLTDQELFDKIPTRFKPEPPKGAK